MPEITMDAKAGFYALAVSAALFMASGAMLSDDAMAQADDVAVQVDEAPVENDVAAAQDEAVVQPVPKRKPAAAERPAKSNLNQSAVRTAPVARSPRPTRTSSRAALPKILGSYR
jgi:hypothetical protein